MGLLDQYQGRVYDLGLLDQKLDSCYSTLEDQSEVSQYVHDQFTKNAENYTKLYNNFAYFEGLIRTTLQRISVPEESNLKILDLGCGSGNTIFPLLNIFPQSEIVATDLSLELLYLLKQQIDSEFKNNNLTLLQLNAEKLNFADNSFDLVVGGAILHHLFHPEKTIVACSRILKRNGHAFFYEPFEEGNAILCYLYESILKDDRDDLPSRSKSFLKQMVTDYKTRIGADINQEIFKRMDDKWLFTKSYFYDLANELDFNKCIIYPLQEPQHLFENKTLANLRFADSADPRDLLPAWAWDKIRFFDQYFSEAFKKELLIEGCVIFSKASAAQGKPNPQKGYAPLLV